MCGINGVISEYALKKSVEIAIEQEDRGQASTGLALYVMNNIEIVKDTITPRKFYKKYKWLFEYNLPIAIGHNRMPSVGKVSYKNAHPFISCNRDFALIHNGTSLFGRDNDKIRKILKMYSHKIYGDTDSELLTHILELYINNSKDKMTALELFAKDWLGGAIIILTKDKEIYGIRNNHNPLNCVVSDKGVYLASEIRAIEKVVKKYHEKIIEKFSLEPYKPIRIYDYRYEYKGKKLEAKDTITIYHIPRYYINYMDNIYYNKHKKHNKKDWSDWFNTC